MARRSPSTTRFSGREISVIPGVVTNLVPPRAGLHNADVVLYSSRPSMREDKMKAADYIVETNDLRDPGARSEIRTEFVGRGYGVARQSRTYLLGDPAVEEVIRDIHFLAHNAIRIGKKKWVEIVVTDKVGLWIAPGVVEEAADYLATLSTPYAVFVEHLALPKGVGG